MMVWSVYGMKRHSPLLLLVVFLAFSQMSSAAQPLSDDSLEMKVKGVAMDPSGNSPIVILEDPQGQHAFPIWIGLPEAQAIVRALEDTPTPRPMTHSLLQNILSGLEAQVMRILINDMHSNTFYAIIVLRQGAKTVTIDARPSDAIALALGAKAPIYVAKKVLGAVRTVNLSPPSSSQRSSQQWGMHLQSLGPELAPFFHLAKPEGVLISFVEVGSQAERHGLRRGDVITDVDGQPIKTLQDLLDILSRKKPDQQFVLLVTRDQRPLRIHLRPVSTE
jgi:bifunctional DNase/RNase